MPLFRFCCPCGGDTIEYCKLNSGHPDIVKCPKCGKDTARYEISACHTEKDFRTPINSIHRPFRTKKEAEAFVKACSDCEVVLDSNDDGSDAAYIPQARNFAARKQMYKYFGLEDKK